MSCSLPSSLAGLLSYCRRPTGPPCPTVRSADPSLIVTAAKPSSRFTCLLASVIAREALVAAGAALAGYQSGVFAGVRECNAYRRSNIDGNPGPAENCRMPLAAGVVAWVAVGFIAIAVGVEIAVVTSRFGHTRSTWGASIAELAHEEHRHETLEDTRSLNPPKA